MLVRLVGQAPITGTVYELEKLRCNLCLEVFTAEAPAGVGEEKYDATSASMMALLKYGSGMPFYRLEGLQEKLEIPLPASTQWGIVKETAEQLEPALEELIRQAAQGEVVYNDDTGMKVLVLDAPDRPERTGVFTSGIISTREGQRMALFFTGRRHAGENLSAVLARRAADLAPPIQMCDALSRNLPKTLEVILGHCLAHGRRRFVKVAQNFPEQCQFVLETLAEIYHNDELTRDQGMSPEQRLGFHQTRSASRDGGTACLAYGTTPREKDGTQLGAGPGDLLFIKSLERADAVSAPAASTPRQQHLRAGAQKSHFASQECTVLQKPERRPSRGSVHEPDPHLRTLRTPIRLII